MDTDSSDDMSAASSSPIAAVSGTGFANFEMFFKHHRAAVNAFGLNLRSSTPNMTYNNVDVCVSTTTISNDHHLKHHHTPSKHHTIDAILGLKSNKDIGGKDDRTDVDSSGKFSL